MRGRRRAERRRSARWSGWPSRCPGYAIASDARMARIGYMGARTGPSPTIECERGRPMPSDVSAHGVHLVGSVPLASADAVFREVAAAIGDRLRRIPDGETGPRSDWIVWQLPVFTAQSDLEIVPPAPDSWRPLPRVRLADTGRADHVRFEPLYEARLLAELEAILGEVPHDQLAIQWDTNFEFGMLEGVFPVWFDDVKGGILERLLRLSRHVPHDVELGYHFCYGDVQGRHFKEPADAGKLVEIANALMASLGRPLNWLHLPVPRERADDAY